MSLPVFKTLGELRANLRDRLGFGGMGSQSGAAVNNLNNILQAAQYQLYWMFDWRYLHRTFDETAVGVDQRFYTLPADLDPMQLQNMVTEDTTISGNGRIWPMIEGIDWQHDNYSSPNQRPRRYEIRDRLEVWPPADRITYIIRYEYVQKLGDFTTDDDRATVDDNVVFLHALATAKGHYGQKDFNIVLGQADTLMRNLRGKNHGNRRYVRKNPEANYYNLDHDDDYCLLVHRNILDV